MDPLSISAGVLAAAAAAAQTVSAFANLREMYKTLPGRLHALNNEVADLALILSKIAAVVENKFYESVWKDEDANVKQLLGRAEEKLHEVDAIVAKIIHICRSKGQMMAALYFKKKMARVRSIQAELLAIRSNLNLILGASNSCDPFLRFLPSLFQDELDLTNLTLAVSGDSAERVQNDHELQAVMMRQHQDTSSLLQSIHGLVEQRITEVERTVDAHSTLLQMNHMNKVGPFYTQPDAFPQRPPRLKKRQTEYPPAAADGEIGITLSQRQLCRPGCSCSCHRESQSGSGRLVDRILGQVFVGYSGIPLVSSKCDHVACERAQTPELSVEYWFPMGVLWSKILRLHLTYRSNIGPTFELKTLRRVPDSAPAVSFALNGNINGLKDLFKKGLASPRDVSDTRGYSLIRWAMYGKKYQTCRFLYHEGADTTYRPIAKSDNSPQHKAHQFLLIGGLPEEDVEALQVITQGSDFIDEQHYTILHKIVLGLSLKDLAEETLRNPELLNTVDAMGRTPLAWASARGDEESVVILLRHGAEVNTVDIQYSGIVGHAADKNSAVCVRLLLEAGADPEIAAKHGYTVANPLNVGARNANDPLVLKTLLDFGADVDSAGVDRVTPLIHAARRNKVDFALLLLEYGAAINAQSSSNQTPLTSAITFNSHHVLQLLLDRWSEYSECPRMQGPNLLEIVATYADRETIRILSGTDHFMLKYDKGYGMGDFTSLLSARVDVDEKFIVEFNDFLNIINKNLSSRATTFDSEADMESGLLVPAIDFSDLFDEFSDAENENEKYSNKYT